MSGTDSQKAAKRIGLSVVVGLVVGLIFYYSGHPEFADFTRPIGVVFIRLLKMIIIPLVFSSVYGAILNLGEPENLTKMGKKAVIYYTLTTSVAVLIGLILVNVFSPGKGSNLLVVDNSKSSMSASNSAPVKEDKKKKQKGLIETVVEVAVTSVPTNPVQAMAENKMLQVIVFAMFLGLAALFVREQADALSKVVASVESLSHTLTNGVMKAAPFGVFALMIDVVAKSGFGALESLGKYMAVVVVGLACHATLLLFLGSYVSKKSPWSIFKNMIGAVLTAFSTSSSAATLPITMECVVENLKVRPKTANFVLPLGATINMDGTALYVSVATVFIAQVYGIDLTIAQQVIIFVTASLAAVGAAAVPGAGLVTMTIVLGSVGLPLEGIQIVIAVDRILDMFRTVVNVLGDSVGSVVVDSLLVKEEQKMAQ
jgi:proton glutamate symport protein